MIFVVITAPNLCVLVIFVNYIIRREQTHLHKKCLKQKCRISISAIIRTALGLMGLNWTYDLNIRTQSLRASRWRGKVGILSSHRFVSDVPSQILYPSRHRMDRSDTADSVDSSLTQQIGIYEIIYPKSRPFDHKHNPTHQIIL